MHQHVRDLSCESSIYVPRSTSELGVRLVPFNMFKPSSECFIDHSKSGPFSYLCFTFVFILRYCLFLAAM